MDEAKNQANRRKHGLDFADAPLVFAGATLTFEDHREPHGEARYLTVGTLAGRMVRRYMDVAGQKRRSKTRTRRQGSNGAGTSRRTR